MNKINEHHMNENKPVCGKKEIMRKYVVRNSVFNMTTQTQVNGLQ